MMRCLHLPLLPVLMLAWRVLLVKRKLCLESLDIKYHHLLKFWRFSCWWQVQSLKYWTLTKSGSILSLRIVRVRTNHQNQTRSKTIINSFYPLSGQSITQCILALSWSERATKIKCNSAIHPKSSEILWFLPTRKYCSYICLKLLWKRVQNKQLRQYTKLQPKYSYTHCHALIAIKKVPNLPPNQMQLSPNQMLFFYYKLQSTSNNMSVKFPLGPYAPGI